jgi:hypothetical protein
MSNNSHDSVDRVKLARICEMLRSENPNERATAGRLATDLLHRAGLTWTTFISRSVPYTSASSAGTQSTHRAQSSQSNDWSWDKRRSQEPRYVRYGRRSVADLIRQLDKISDRLGRWDREFLQRLKQRPAEEGLTQHEWQLAERTLNDARSSKWRRQPKYSRTYTRA